MKHGEAMNSSKEEVREEEAEGKGKGEKKGWGNIWEAEWFSCFSLISKRISKARSYLVIIFILGLQFSTPC